MNIRFPLYDFFGYLLPGIVAVLATLLVVWSLYFPAVPLSFLSLPKHVWFLLVVLAYFAGHLVQAIGNLFSNWLVKAGCVAAPDWRGRALLAEALLRLQHPESCPVRGKASFISIATR